MAVVNNPMTENLDGGGYVISNVADITAKGPLVDVRAYASINAAVTAIGATQTTLLVPNAQTLTSNLTIPSTLSLKILKGGSIVKASTYTLTINGPFDAGLYQVFSGFSAGDVTFGAGAVKEVYAEWWGIDGVADEVQINCAMQAFTGDKGKVKLTGQSYNTADSINLETNVTLEGNGAGVTEITYSGSGSAIVLSAVQYAGVTDLKIQCTHDDSNGILAGNQSRRNRLERLAINNDCTTTSVTGAGIKLYDDAGWSGGLSITDVHITSFKYGVQFVGDAVGSWTAVNMVNVWLVGKSGIHVTGSAGISMDTLTNGIGSYFFGGTIESFATGVSIDQGTGGQVALSVYSNFEDNTVNYSVGINWDGEIQSNNGGWSYRQGTNAAANLWYRELDESGNYTKETYYNQRHVVYNGVGGLGTWGFYMGTPPGGSNSFIGGGNPYPAVAVSLRATATAEVSFRSSSSLLADVSP